MLPAFSDIPLEPGTNVAAITGVTLQVTGVPDDWTFFQAEGTADLRLELRGDFVGWGEACSAEYGIENISVTWNTNPGSRKSTRPGGP